MSFWQNFSKREKTLLGVAGLIALLVLGQIFVVRPIQFSKEELKTTLARQNATLDELAILPRVSEAEPVTNAPPARNTDALRQILLDSATNSGLGVNRIQNNGNSVTLYFDRTLPELFFLWIRTVEAERALKPEQFNIRRTGENEIRASVEFVGG